MTDGVSVLLHGSCVAIAGRAVLVTGVSGAGKSDLCLRLIDRGAVLVSDDQTHLTRAGDRLLARAPASIRGKIEVRGFGIFDIDCIDDVPLALLVTLGGTVERFPTEGQRAHLAGLEIPQVALSGFEASTPLKVEMALARMIP